MAQSTPETIILEGAERCIQYEATAGGTITPGHLVALNSAGAVVVHPTAAGAAPERAFALEDDAQGRGITDAYDASTYKSVRYAICPPGTKIYAIISPVTQSIAIGDKLESAGNGMLREHVPQVGADATSPAIGVRVGQIVAVALEAVTVTSPATGARCRVRTV